MKPDISPAIETQAQARWVEGELVRSLVRTARNWQFLGLVLAAVVLGLLWDDAPTWEKALRKLRGHLMPPPGLPQPPQQTCRCGASSARPRV